MNWLTDKLAECVKSESDEERENLYNRVQDRLDDIGNMVGYCIGLYTFDEDKGVSVYAFPVDLVNSLDLKWKREEFFCNERDGIRVILHESIGQLDYVYVIRMILTNGMFEGKLRHIDDYGGSRKEFLEKLAKTESCKRDYFDF